MKKSLFLRLMLVVWLLGLASMACAMPVHLAQTSVLAAVASNSSQGENHEEAATIKSIDDIPDGSVVQVTYGNLNDCMYMIYNGTTVMFNKMGSYVFSDGTKKSLGSVVRESKYNSLDEGNKKYLSGYFHKEDGKLLVYEKQADIPK
jgi:hypothetical protein